MISRLLLTFSVYSPLAILMGIGLRNKERTHHG
jgi:hypothetical protein